MRHGSLFSGIGGFDLAAEWMGWENVFSCEINPFGNKVLKYYWPDTIHYEDITKTDFTIHRGGIDILTGGFPCQPFSQAGKRKGTEDDRHLWPRMLEVIRDVQPIWVVGENVHGLINWDGGLVFDQVQADLEAEGYEVQPVILPAASVNAPHRRDRVWFVAKRIDANTSSNAITGQDGESNKIKGERTPINEQVGRGQFETIQYKGLDDLSRNAPSARLQRQEERPQPAAGSDELCEERDAADTKSTGLERKNESRRGKRGQRVQVRRNPAGYYTQDGNGGNVTDTQRIESPREEHRQEKSGQHTEKNQRCGWADFPTQSPVCSRDDGLSSRLDGISFPKWRNESIKAYGNAIVPQVVYEIFKVIDKMQNQ